MPTAIRRDVPMNSFSYYIVICVSDVHKQNVPQATLFLWEAGGGYRYKDRHFVSKDQTVERTTIILIPEFNILSETARLIVTTPSFLESNKHHKISPRLKTKCIFSKNELLSS